MNCVFVVVVQPKATHAFDCFRRCVVDFFSEMFVLGRLMPPLPLLFLFHYKTSICLFRAWKKLTKNIDSPNGVAK